MIEWEVRILADNEQQDDYLSNMLNAMNEKEQEIQTDINDPEEVARQAKEKLEAENSVKEANEPEREADADAKLEELLDNTPLEEAAGAILTSDDNSELSDSDMERLMNMNLDDIIDDVKSDSVSIDDLFGNTLDDSKKNTADNDNAKINEQNIEGSGNMESEGREPENKESNSKEPDNKESDNKESDSTGSDITEPDNADSGTADNNSKADEINAADKKKLKPKKESFFKKIKKVFFDSLEDDAESAEAAAEMSAVKVAVAKESDVKETAAKDSEIGADAAKQNEVHNTASSGDEPKDENEQIIEDVFGNKSTLDDSQAPKKGFFAKFKYRLEQMKAKRIEEEKAEEEAERLDDEEKQKNKELKKAAAAEKKEQKKQAGEAKKAQKANKPKKAKPAKPKKVKKPKEPPKPQDILKIKPLSIVMLVMFVAGVSVLISVLNSAFYYNNSVSQAKDYYSNEQYEKAYEKLSGIKLNGSDKTLYEQASTIMYVQKQYDSYENYMKLNMKTEALDSLIKGVNRYNSLRSQAQELGIDSKFTAVYQQIVSALQDTFKISETEAAGLSSMSDTDFTNYYYRIEEYGKAVQ